MKILLLAFMVAGCVAIGYIFSLKYSRRANFFKTLVMLCQKLDVEINYSRERLKNLFLGFDAKTKKNLQGLDKNYIAYLDGTAALDENSLFNNMTFLKQEEKDSIFIFFKSLGRSDLASQSQELKNYEKRFEEFSTASRLDHKKYGALSIKLGIIAALVVLVLFI